MTKKVWNLLKTMIGKNNDISGIPLHFKNNNDINTNSDQIANALCNYFTNVGPKYAKSMHQSKNAIFNISLKLP